MSTFYAVQLLSERTRDVSVAKQATEGRRRGQEPNLIPFGRVLFLWRLERYAAGL